LVEPALFVDGYYKSRSDSDLLDLPDHARLEELDAHFLASVGSIPDTHPIF
jgi:hypothetical protein